MKRKNQLTISLEQLHSSEGKAWTVSLYLNNTKLEFKIDTGAEVTVIPESVTTPYQSLLQTTSRRLQGPGKIQLEVCGQFTGTLKKDTQVVEEEIYVEKDLHMPLLGLPAITSLNLVTKICGIQLDKDTVVSKFPELFTGLGKLQGEYDIKLSDNAVPFALTTPRRIPLPLMTPVKEQLEKMEKADIISRVEGPTDWCAIIVVVPKPNNQVRICVDLTQLNKSVKRERHILPSVDHTLAQLSNAKLFSKIDANSGFWQVELSKQSSLLTTFITLFGRFRFNRLPFGISSAPELFQQRMSVILEGLEGVTCLMDDILVHGANQQEHDTRLLATLEQLRKYHVTLNPENVNFSKRLLGF